MNSSMGDYLSVVTPHLHPELVSPEAMSNLQALTQILPPFSKAMLEFRLGAGRSQVDLSVFFSCCTPDLPEQFLNHPAWQALQKFCREWVDPTSFLYRRLKYIGLEFDLDTPQPQVPIPSIFISWHRGIVSDAQVLARIAPRIPNYPASSQLESNLRRCVDVLPKSARFESIGVMLSRPAQAVRVIVADIPLQEVPDYLVQIGWSEPTNRLSKIISALSDFVDEIRLLSFDVGNIFFPRVGLEFYPKQHPAQEPHWQLFFNHLVEMGLCTPAKKNAFLAWPGFSQRADQPELWPFDLLVASLLRGSGALSIFWRKINHVKIVYQPDSSLEAKGYLTFGHNWFNSSDLTICQEVF